MARHYASMALAAAIAAIAVMHSVWQSAERSAGWTGAASLTTRAHAIAIGAVFLGVLGGGDAQSSAPRMARMRRATQRRHWRMIRRLRIASRKARMLAEAAARAQVVRLGIGETGTPPAEWCYPAAPRPSTGPGP